MRSYSFCASFLGIIRFGMKVFINSFHKDAVVYLQGLTGFISKSAEDNLFCFLNNCKWNLFFFPDFPNE